MPPSPKKPFVAEWLDSYCAICGKQQFTCPDGESCEDGHVKDRLGYGAPGSTSINPIKKTVTTDLHTKDRQPVFEQEPTVHQLDNPFVSGNRPELLCKVHVEGSVARGRNYGSIRITIGLDIPADLDKIREAAEWGAVQMGEFLSGEWDNIETIYQQL